MSTPVVSLQARFIFVCTNKKCKFHRSHILKSFVCLGAGAAAAS